MPICTNVNNAALFPSVLIGFWRGRAARSGVGTMPGACPRPGKCSTTPTNARDRPDEDKHQALSLRPLRLCRFSLREFYWALCLSWWSFQNSHRTRTSTRHCPYYPKTYQLTRVLREAKAAARKATLRNASTLLLARAEGQAINSSAAARTICNVCP